MDNMELAEYILTMPQRMVGTVVMLNGDRQLVRFLVVVV
jgi:hypothetical protein